MPEPRERAIEVLKEFKGEKYAFGGGVLDTAPGKFAAEFGGKALFVGPVAAEWFRPVRDRVLRSLEKALVFYWSYGPGPGNSGGLRQAYA